MTQHYNSAKHKAVETAPEKISLTGYKTSHKAEKSAPYSNRGIVVVIVGVVVFLAVIFAFTRGGANNTASNTDSVTQDGPSGDQLDVFDIE